MSSEYVLSFPTPRPFPVDSARCDQNGRACDHVGRRERSIQSDSLDRGGDPDETPHQKRVPVVESLRIPVVPVLPVTKDEHPATPDAQEENQDAQGVMPLEIHSYS